MQRCQKALMYQAAITQWLKKNLPSALLEIKRSQSLFSFMYEWLHWFGKSADWKQIEDSFQVILWDSSPFIPHKQSPQTSSLPFSSLACRALPTVEEPHSASLRSWAEADEEAAQKRKTISAALPVLQHRCAHSWKEWTATEKKKIKKSSRIFNAGPIFKELIYSSIQDCRMKIR